MLQGIFPVLPTIFDATGKPDLGEHRQVTRFAIASGAHGLVYPGVASECNLLTEEERVELVSVLAAEVGDRIPIVVGASSPESDVVIRLGRHALELGIRHLMVMAPGNLGANVTAHQDFFGQIASALPESQILLQNAPAPIGAGLSPPAVCEIAAKVTNVRLIKEEALPAGPRIMELLASKPDSVEAVFGGGGSRYIIDELNRGAKGTIPAAELTDLHVALFEAHQRGNADLARQLYRLSLPLLVAQRIYRMRLTKYVLKQRGICSSDYVRAELPELDDLARKDIDQMLADLQESASNNVFRWTEASSCMT